MRNMLSEVGEWMDKATQWLLDGDPWVEYRTRLDLLNQPGKGTEVAKAREKMLAHPQILGLISDFSRWGEEVVSNHKSAGMLIHKLVFLADIGMTIEDPGVSRIADRILEHTAENGVIQVPVNIPVHFGGTGKTSWSWTLCDTPSIFYALGRMGLRNNSGLLQGMEALRKLVRDNGFPCATSGEFGKFRGPGKKDDFCPYATMIMLKALMQFDEFKGGRECRIAAEALLDLWAHSRQQHPYMFYTGTDFRKLKAPFVWYDILHVADVLSQCDWLKGDARLLEMAGTIGAGADPEGCFRPQSEWKAWNGWEFGQKKVPSRWVTLLAMRIRNRM